MRQERLLSVGTDGGGYINLLCTNKDDLSLRYENGRVIMWESVMMGESVTGRECNDERVEIV